MTDWWWSPEWLAYERACGREGERARVLAGADWNTRVVDLRRPLDQLWTDVRKSYHSIVSGFDRQVGLTCVSLNPTAFVKACLPLHVREAGRMTRPIESWEIQAGWIRAGKAFALIAMKDAGAEWLAEGIAVDEFGDPCAEADYVVAHALGFVFIIAHGTWAYYMSAAATERNVTHGLIWRAIRLMKERGTETFEIGWQGEAQDDKGKAIEFFRRGFGGTDVPARLERVQ